MDPIREAMLKKSRSSKLERRGKTISLICISLIVLVVVAIFFFVASKGLATFFQNKFNLWSFLSKSVWNPSIKDAHGNPEVGALPMIVGSFGVTFLSALVATPFAVGAGIFMTEISLSVIVPFIRHIFGGTGFGILAGTFVLFVMILPTVTSMTVDALKAVPRHYREASLALGATRWQTTYRVVLRAAIPGILTGIVFGMARAFGEALAVQMVIGNAALLPKNLVSPASTLTSVLTSGIGNTVMGSLENNALWSLALLLLLMSLAFNLLIRWIGKKGELNK